MFFWFGFVGVFFCFCLILVPYKYSVGGGHGSLETILSCPAGKGSVSSQFKALFLQGLLEQVAVGKKKACCGSSVYTGIGSDSKNVFALNFS